MICCFAPVARVEFRQTPSKRLYAGSNPAGSADLIVKLMSEAVNKLTNEITQEFESFKIRSKQDSRLMKTIDIFLKIISFGKLNSFMKFTTTVGYTVYVPETWADKEEEKKIELLRHERIHMRQRKKWSILLFPLMYLMLPFPVLFAWFRLSFEKEAYEESMRTIYELDGNTSRLRTASYKEAMTSKLVGPPYFWAWYRKRDIESWFENFVASLESGSK